MLKPFTRRAIGLAFALLALAPARADTDLPTTGPMPMGTFVGTYLNPTLRGMLNDVRAAKTANYTVASGDNGRTIALGGSTQFTLTLNAASGYAAQFCVRLVNEDTARGKIIAPNGLTSFVLYPSQLVTICNQNNVWQAYGGGQRWRLTAATTLRVNKDTGSDSNDCLSTSTPCLTIQGAVNVVANNLDLAGRSDTTITVTCSSPPCTYSAVVAVTVPWVGANDSNAVTLNGDTTTPANVTINTAATAITVRGYGATLAIQGFKLTTSAGHGIAVVQGARATLSGKMEFGSCAANHMQVTQASVLLVTAAYTISGGAQSHHNLVNNSVLLMSAITVTLSGTPAFSVAFIQASKAATTNSAGVTYSGSATTPTDKRAFVTTNAVVDSGGAGNAYFPGTGIVTAQSGGLYQ